MRLNINDTFNKELPADPNRNNTRRQVEKACFSFVTPRVPSDPKIVHVSDETLEAIGLKSEDAVSDQFASVFSGASVYEGTDPFAMCYGGHQFGNWAGQLGDGRAINLTEVVHKDKRWALQLKGSGETPYSRSADGLAVLRSSVREHLCSEAMYHLGVPTTRSLSLAITGDQVLRDMLYNGNSEYEKGAVVCRVSPSFIRFGNFQILAARRDTGTLKQLLDYTMTHFYPDIKGREAEDYIQFFQEVTKRTLDMIVHWQRVGFVHGVMNTDNMSILGLTIDYGPYGWLEGYDPGWTPNTTDAQGKRYRYGNQLQIGLWNLLQLGNAIYTVVDDVPALEKVLKYYQDELPNRYLTMMHTKLGLMDHTDMAEELISQLDEILQLTETDVTIFYRNLAKINSANDTANDVMNHISDAFYKPEEVDGPIKEKWHKWCNLYLERLRKESLNDEERSSEMNRVNPKYVLRNYMAQMAIDKADQGDYSLIDELYQLLKQPYAEQKDQENWFAKRPEWARNKVGCSMLSCSS